MKELKSAILSNLDFLPNKVNLTKKDNEMVTLQANYFDKETTRNYFLKVEVYVFKKTINEQVEIKDFEVEDIVCFYDNGNDSPFKFTKKELTDYIDF